MDRIDQSCRLVLGLLKSYVEERPVAEGVETQLITDAEHNHSQLVNVGWLSGLWIYGCILHVDLKGDKVWIQHNGTERLVAEKLVEFGVPKEQIVLGFQTPSRRRLTEFAVN